MFDLLSTVQFPDGPSGFLGIRGAVFSVVEWLYNGIGSYAVAIIIFTLLLRLVMIPLDFGVKYFTKKNSIRMAAMKPEQDAIAEAYAGDPLGKQRAQQALFKKHGGGMAGFCLFQILNMAIMMIIFFSVFQALNGISNHNVSYQFHRLYAVHEHHRTLVNGEYVLGDMMVDVHGNQWLDENGNPVSITFQEAINAEYNATRTGFLWVHSMWRPDTWANRTLSWSQFRSATNSIDGWGSQNQPQLERMEGIYNDIFNRENGIDQTGRGWNGMLFLILFAAGATYLSMLINAKVMQSTKVNQPAKKEAEVGYSIRKVKNTSSSGEAEKLPSIDPASATKMMKFILPVIMVVFTMTTTAALAIYISAGALFMTGISFAMNFLVEKLIKWQDKRKKEKESVTVDGDVITINPHSKYFKSRAKKKEK
ncbi:MAG: YidC/Oxa1 family membrane protein insertase [Firmicutes bacterium]|nr:YidC/Oxa1 family membrane protein insertase [Bacillota bacterium]